jgi:hypothetical protein
MRRPSPLALLLTLALTASVAASLPGSAVAAGPRADADTPRPVGVALSETTEVLARAAGALDGDAGPARADATLALRDLFLARPSLDEDDETEADRLLARPTDGVSDPYRDGYATSSVKTCAKHVCVHYVRSGADAPPSTAWAKNTLSVMERVWRHHVGKLDYRKPARDGSRGGNKKFDVYLKEIGSDGLYGYCAPENRVAGKPKQASGFCVLDDDFARSQFARAPIESLKVTAAHEFFHAIQFAYDYTEDPWFLESTATWIEERFADGVNDNRSYLKFGQASRSTKPLDLFDSSGLAHYGNWVFWEYLSERYGNTIVRQTIQRAGTGGGLPDDYSIQALKKVLKKEGGLPSRYAAFAAANTAPAKSYDEGSAFPGVSPIKVAKFRSKKRSASVTTKINHLAAKTVDFKPKKLTSKKWKLRITVDAPRAATSPAVALTIKRSNGKLLRRTVSLDKSGSGTKEVAFSSRKVRSVSVTLANASTRYNCNSRTGFACEGRPLDQGQRFTVDAKARRG